MNEVQDSGLIALMLGGFTNSGITGINQVLNSGKVNGKDITDDERLLLEQAISNFNEVKNKYFAKIDKPKEDPNYANYNKMILNIVNTHNKDRGSSHSSFGKIEEGFAVGTQQGTTKEIKSKGRVS